MAVAVTICGYGYLDVSFRWSLYRGGSFTQTSDGVMSEGRVLQILQVVTLAMTNKVTIQFR